MGITVELMKVTPINMEETTDNMRNICKISGKYYSFDYIADNGDSRITANKLSTICSEKGSEMNNRIVLLNRETFCEVIPEFIAGISIYGYSFENYFLSPYMDYSDFFIENLYLSKYVPETVAKLRFERLSKLAELFEVKFPFKRIEKLQELIEESREATQEDYENGFTNDYIKFEEYINELLGNKESIKKALLNATKDKYQNNYALFWEE